MAGLFAAQMLLGDMAQLGINQRQQAVQGGLVAIGVLVYEQRYGSTLRHPDGDLTKKRISFGSFAC
jgi:hypothetical protein